MASRVVATWTIFRFCARLALVVHNFQRHNGAGNRPVVEAKVETRYDANVYAEEGDPLLELIHTTGGTRPIVDKYACRHMDEEHPRRNRKMFLMVCLVPLPSAHEFHGIESSVFFVTSLRRVSSPQVTPLPYQAFVSYSFGLCGLSLVFRVTFLLSSLHTRSRTFGSPVDLELVVPSVSAEGRAQQHTQRNT